MSYVELIVVLAIFFTLAGAMLLNSGTFQKKVEISSLSNDIALKIVEAQKSAISGKLPPLDQQQYLYDQGLLSWKPSYGINFDLNASTKSFVYFVDLDSDSSYNEATLGLEKLDTFNLTKSNYIERIELTFDNQVQKQDLITLSLSVTRPNSGFVFSGGDGATSQIFSNADYVKIFIASSGNSLKSTIKVYPSGRLEIE